MIGLLLALIQAAPPGTPGPNGQVVISGMCVPGQLGSCFSLVLETTTWTTSVDPLLGPIRETSLKMLIQNQGSGSYSLGKRARFTFPKYGLAINPNDPRHTPGPQCSGSSAGFVAMGTTCNLGGNSLVFPGGPGTLINGASFFPGASGDDQWLGFADIGFWDFIVRRPVYGCNAIVDPSDDGYYQTCGNNQWVEFNLQTHGDWNIATDLDFLGFGDCAIYGPLHSGARPGECDGAVTVTPEPFTIVLVGSGLAGIAWRRRRERHALG